MKAVHGVIIALLLLSTCVPTTSALDKAQLDLILGWITSGNKFLIQRATSTISAKLSKAMIDKVPELMPLINASIPIITHEGMTDVLGVVLPLYQAYSRPSLIKRLSDERFRNFTYLVVDEFQGAIENKTGIDENDPKESLRLIFDRVDWTRILPALKPFLNTTRLLHNELLQEIVGDFIPKPMIKKLVPIIDLIVKRLKYSDPNAKPDNMSSQAAVMKRKLMYNFTTLVVDEFYNGLQSMTGFDGSDPKEQMIMLFDIVDWKKIFSAAKPFMNSSRLLHNELIQEIIGDFIPKEMLQKFIPVVERFLSRFKNPDPNSPFRKAAGLFINQLFKVDLSGLSDNFMSNVKLIFSQVEWSPIIATLLRMPETNETITLKDIGEVVLKKYRTIASQLNFDNYINQPNTTSDQCHEDLMYTLKGTVTFKKWAMQMLDAHGKLGAGLMRGRLHAMGSYQQCNDIVALDYKHENDTEGTERFKGQYCRVMWSISKELIYKLTKRESPLPMTFAWGVCVPNSCKSTDVMGYVPTTILPVYSIYCGEKPVFKDDAAAVSAMVIIISIIIFIVVGTVFDLVLKCLESNSSKSNKSSTHIYSIPRPSGDDYEMKAALREEMSYLNDSNNTTTKLPLVNGNDEYAVLRAGEHEGDADSNGNAFVVLLRSASIIANLKSLISRHTTKDTIECMHGIRVFSMSWIILISTYYFAIFSEIGIPLTENLLDAKKLTQRFVVQLITSGPLAIDTFFLLGATLASFWMLKRLEQDVSVKVYRVVQYITHRLIRILPLYMIMLMAFVSLYQYKKGGPLGFSKQPAAENCRTYWWTNLLFINNFVHHKEACMPWSWYLANDMQYYLIALIFIIVIYKYPKIGLSLTLGLGSIGIISTAAIENQGAGGLLVPASNKELSFKHDVWMAPWCRVTPYAIGIILGYILHKTKKQQGSQKQYFSKLFYIIGWIVTIGCGLAIVFLPYTEMGKGTTKWSQSVRTAFESLHHTAWALCVSFVIFACHMGYGSYINDFLSWTMWVPLSRVTFAAYLVHPVMMVIYVYSRMQLVYLADLALLYMFIGHWVFTYLFAFALTACVEMPFRQVEKVMIKSRRSPCCKRSS